jgi:hypothetical protein
VQEVHFACAHYQASVAAVVARNGFTRAAIQAAKTSGVHLLRPTEVAIGCPFDRTLHKKEIERQRRDEYQAQENNRKSEIWKQYDVAFFAWWLISRPSPPPKPEFSPTRFNYNLPGL